ncbi:Inner membrane protein YhaH [compost metagenome]
MAGTNGLISNLYALALLVPGIAVGVRRMHDTDRSGWWLLLPFVNIVFLCQDSTPGANRFGPNPKGIA